ncbi:hypothetical protein RhiirA4_449694, partial [Rhizophagus irregularis]
MGDSYNCLRLNNKRVFQVEVYEDKDRQKFFEFATSRKRREWAVTSTINSEVRGSVYFVDPTEASGPLFNLIKKGEFVALYGARASGKSTRVDQAMIELEKEGYVCIYISFKGVNMDTKDIFWSSVGTKLAFHAPKYFKSNEVKSVDDFMLR